MPDDQKPIPSPPWRDSLTLVVGLLVVWNVLILCLLYTGATDQSIGDDAAGAGMGRGFREMYAIVIGIGIAVVALPTLVISHRGLRLALIVLLAVVSLLTPLML